MKGKEKLMYSAPPKGIWTWLMHKSPQVKSSVGITPVINEYNTKFVDKYIHNTQSTDWVYSNALADGTYHMIWHQAMH